MPWLIVTIFAYFLLAIVFLVDKYLLAGPIPNPKVYTFYIGILGILVSLLIPFINFSFPAAFYIFLALMAGAIFIYALFWFNNALYFFEASRIVPAVGGLIPLFTFWLTYLFSKGKETLNFSETLAFFLLLFGSIFITLEKQKSITLRSLRISTLAAFLFSLSFVLTKYVYLAHPFWSGYILIRIGGFLVAFFSFLFSPEIKEEIFKKRITFKKNTMGIFLSNQLAGAGANILQNWAIALAPLAYVAIINALQGIQYAFLLIFTILLSLKFPQILKERISKKVIFQKIIAILLIGAGLVLLVL